MEKPFFSIIIPMYKVAEHVTRCIESLENQDISKDAYEIICINDGSPDNCQEIIENLQKKYSNIVLLNQENQGVSMARNNGIAIAKGNYILPIDPDDYVVENSFSRIVSLLETKDLDVLYLGFEIFDEAGKSIWKTNYTEQSKVIHSGIEGYFNSRGFEVKDPDRSWAILYKKQLLDKYSINYPKNVPYLEDGLFLAKVFTVAQKVSFDNVIFYQRTTRKGSATNSNLFYTDKALNGFILAISDIKDFANKNQLSTQQHQLVNHVVAKFIILSVSSSILNLKLKKYYQILDGLDKKDMLKISIDGLRLEYKKLAEIFNFNKLLFFVYFYFHTKLKIYKK